MASGCWHNGALPGYRGYLAFCPVAGTGVAVLGDAAISVDDLGADVLSGLKAYPLAPPSLPRPSQFRYGVARAVEVEEAGHHAGANVETIPPSAPEQAVGRPHRGEAGEPLASVSRCPVLGGERHQPRRSGLLRWRRRTRTRTRGRGRACRVAARGFPLCLLQASQVLR